MRQGWSWAGRGAVRTRAWSVDASKRSIFDGSDQMAVRLSQPLRVEGGGVDLKLPTAYDYETGAATWTRERLSLTPRGRQIDAEAVYARPLAGGWVTGNLFYRRESGNLAWFPEDVGAAVRFSVGF
jgi:hypothetical protein